MQEKQIDAPPVASGEATGNRFLDRLESGPRAHLAGAGRLVELQRGTITNTAGRPIEYVDFPIDAVLSVIATFANGTQCEVAVIGREGFVETEAAFGITPAARSTVCQLAGHVLRVPRPAFDAQVAASPELGRLVRRIVGARLFVTEQIAACNLKHSIEQRVARWLLMTADRIPGNRIALTHEAISGVLSTRRAGITVTAAALAESGAISYARGAITIRDRERLAAVACECYRLTHGAVEQSLIASS